MHISEPVAEPISTACEEKARLLERCALAEWYCTRTIEKITWRIGEPRVPNYEELQDLVQAARKLMEDAQEALVRHAAEHGC
jgi:DNA phosphorothioation-dependent restriction protein DptG